MFEPIIADLVEERNKLSDNHFAAILLDRLHKSHSLNKDLINLQSAFSDTLSRLDKGEETVFQEIVPAQLERDYRIKEWYVRGVKSLGEPDGSDGTPDKFGMIACITSKDPDTDKGDYSSVLVFGNNGVGKSSLYLSLELGFNGSSGLALHRGIDMHKDYSRFKNFIKNVRSSEDKFLIEIKTQNGKLSYRLGDEEYLRLPKTFFCSEYDIVSMMGRDRTGESVSGIKRDYDYIENEIGLSRYKKLIIDIGNLVTEKANLDKNRISFEKDIENCKNKIGLYEEALRIPVNTEDGVVRFRDNLSKNESVFNIMQNESVEDQRAKLNRDLSECKKKYDKLNKSLSRKFPESRVNPEYYRKGISEVSDVYNWLRAKYNSRLEGICKTVVELIPEIFGVFLDKDENLEINVMQSDKGLKYLSIMIRVDNDKTQSSVESFLIQDYFNTFRLKLFCVTFKIILSLAVSRKWRIKAPVMIDDVFESSDFRNRVGVDAYMHSIVKAVRNVGGDDIQFLIFTQDELVAEGLYRGCVWGNTNVMLAKMMPVGSISVHHEDDVAHDVKRLPYLEVCRCLRTYTRIKQVDRRYIIRSN